MEFQDFPKIARLARDVIVTEKIDGTNAQVCIAEDGTLLAVAARAGLHRLMTISALPLGCRRTATNC